MLKKLALLTFALLLSLNSLKSQVTADHKPILDKIFKDRPEVYFEFNIRDKSEISHLTRIISIDNVIGNQVKAYANRSEFSLFLESGIPYTVLPVPAMEFPVKVKESVNLKSEHSWDFYPSYPAYESMMAQFEDNYPALCLIDTAGVLSSGRKLLVAKITSNVNAVMNKPQFLWVSSMHGDELTGYVLSLRMIDYLLSNYGVNPRITSLLDKVEIYFNPLMNPDGTFYGGNNSVNDAMRYNGNGIDVNRNFPDPQAGDHPDGNSWQPETVIMMNYANAHHFSMGGNFHGGIEVINYPWDTWAMLHPDDNWWVKVSRAYADTAHVNSAPGYMTDLDNGITNGYAWYQITGGRQDYMNYFQRAREATFEISNNKLPPASQLPAFWNYNYRSMLNYMEEITFSVHGVVTDSLTGVPLKAKAFINGHDHDSSHVWSNLPLGNYYRLLNPGTYIITYTSPGYWPKSHTVNVVNHQETLRDVKLVPLSIGIPEEQLISPATLLCYPNPAADELTLKSAAPWSGIVTLEVFNAQTQLVLSQKIKGDALLGGHPLFIEGIAKGLLMIRVSNHERNETIRILNAGR